MVIQHLHFLRPENLGVTDAPVSLQSGNSDGNYLQVTPQPGINQPMHSFG